MTISESMESVPDSVRVILHAHEEFRERTSIVVNMDTLEVIELDDIGRVMWSALRETGSLAETVVRLLEEFDADAHQLELDVHRFVGELRDLGLVANEDRTLLPVVTVTKDPSTLYLDLAERSLLGLLSKSVDPTTTGPSIDSILAGTAINTWYRRGMPGMTMIGFPRLRNVRALAERAIDDQIPGDFVETGVWRGGATIMMRAVLEARGDASRKVWVCDSFEGLPVPDLERYPDDAFWINGAGEIAVSLDEVRENFSAYGLLDDRVEFLKGWFSDTMPNAPMSQIALLRLDGDLHQSTTEVLEALYPKVSPGGYVIIDDYCIGTCSSAVDEFREKYSITEELQIIDWTGVFWQVPPA